MSSRLLFRISQGALVVLTSLVACACVDNYDDQPSGPPPVGPGPGKTPAGTAGNTTPTGMIMSATRSMPATGMMKAATLDDADSGRPSTRDGGQDDSDAGLQPDAGGSLGGSGAAGRLAAGSGGRSGAGGVGGSGGQGAADGGTSPQCQSQFCFSIVDCWLLDETSCNYRECINFTCM